METFTTLTCFCTESGEIFTCHCWIFCSSTRTSFTSCLGNVPLVMQVLIRPYRPSDKDAVLTLFSNGILEHIRPCFYNAMTSPLYIAITLALCVPGYLLDSMLGAVVLPGAWVGLIYYCCHELYAGYVREKLQTDMQDIPGNYMSRPDDCFWVAEAEVDGRAQIMGTVAVVAKQSGKERHGELFRMITSSSYRRLGLGSKLTQTVVDFCKERGFSKVVLETSSTQTAGVALYKKLGFRHFRSHTKTHSAHWKVKLTGVTILLMEKHL
ncbi:probable N-acetyltransferase camello isoform X7 [Epinephelus fuscoguttatus]|uniref:probable N-acetyltransferase camello isoform X7 n=1 Tax=Epinephelus fuscoguttatus TaxID=293821 RepID=UPI0020D18E5A|nr:probable N-acetyltransferase camello isoform X7 [Epinephelus fuscoguttatus]